MIVNKAVAVIARTDGASSTNGFTDNKHYPLIHVYDHGRSGTVRNDNGHLRDVPLDGSKTAHFKIYEECVGRFDVEYASRRHNEIRNSS